MTDKLNPVSDVLDVLGVSISTFERLVRDREISVVRFRGSRRVRDSELERFIDIHSTPRRDDTPRQNGHPPHAEEPVSQPVADLSGVNTLDKGGPRPTAQAHARSARSRSPASFQR